MKIAAIMGSPHKGNSFKATERIEKKLTDYGDVEFEYILLKDMDIKPCRGCFTCFLKGEENCPLKDDKPLIDEKIERADGVIFASPVYAMHISYLMKQYIDRSAYIFHRPRYFGKHAIAVCTAGAVGTKEALSYLKIVASGWGFAYVDGLGYSMPPKEMNMPPLQNKDRTDAVVDRFYRAMKEKLPARLSLMDHIGFHAMREVYSRMENHSPTDYAYWKAGGWFDKKTRYYTSHTKTGPFKGFAARVVSGFIARQIDKSMKRKG